MELAHLFQLGTTWKLVAEKKTPSVGCRSSLHHKCEDNSGGVGKVMMDSEETRRREESCKAHTPSEHDKTNPMTLHKCEDNSGGKFKNPKSSEKENYMRQRGSGLLPCVGRRTKEEKRSGFR